MSNAVKVAIVTGANRGIGLEVVKGICKSKFKGVVYLTARDEEQGKKSVEDLKQQGLTASFHQLDIDNIESIKKFASYIKQKYNGIDILINNAAIAYKNADPTPFAQQAVHTIRVNFTGTVNVCNALFPLLRPHARVVNVSSRAGMLKVCKDAAMRARLTSNTATVDDIANVLSEFVDAAQKSLNEPIATTAYGMSKVGLTAATIVQQRLFDQNPTQDIIINACCPGLIATGMSSYHGKPVEEGAITPLYLAFLPENASGPRGELWAEKKKVQWEDLSWTWGS